MLTLLGKDTDVTGKLARKVAGKEKEKNQC